MSKLTVNLKPLYQNNTMLIWLPIMLSQYPLIFSPIREPKEGNFMGYLIVSFIMGFLIAGLQKDIQTKPFTFCLPGHRHLPRRLMIICAIVVNTLLALLFLRYPGLNFLDTFLAILAAALFGIMTSLLSGWLAFIGNSSVVILSFSFLILFSAMYLGLHKMVERVIVTSPLIVILSAILICYFLLRRWKLRCDVIARNNCGRLERGTFESYNRDKQQRYREAQAAKKATKRGTPSAQAAALEEYFLTKMSCHDFFSKGKTIWAELYIFLGRIPNLGLWKTSAAYICFVLLAGYLPGSVGNLGHISAFTLDLICLFPVIVTMQYEMPAYCSLLLPAGRREKYYSTLMTALTITALGTLLVMATAAISILFESVMPALELKGISFTYHRMHIELFYICPLLMLIGFILNMLIPQYGVSAMFISGSLVFFTGIIGVDWRGWLNATGPIEITAAMLSTWLIFMAVLRWHCTHRNLVGAGR